LQGYKANQESVEMKRNKERQDEGHKNGNSVTETKGTAEPSEQAQRTANENGAAKVSERIETEDEQGEGNMKYQDDKLNAEEKKQIYESKTKRNDPGNEEKHNVKNESERSDETENGNGSKENTDHQDRQGAAEEDHVTDKRQWEDGERHQAEAEIKSEVAGNKKDRDREQERNSIIKLKSRPLLYILEINVRSMQYPSYFGSFALIHVSTVRIFLLAKYDFFPYVSFSVRTSIFKEHFIALDGTANSLDERTETWRQ